MTVERSLARGDRLRGLRGDCRSKLRDRGIEICRRDRAVQKAQPFADELKTAVEQSQARPVSPVYPQISQAIYENVNEALAGRASPEEALKTAQSEMQSALETF